MWDLSSPTRDQTFISCIARQILNLWTTREVPILLKPHFPATYWNSPSYIWHNYISKAQMWLCHTLIPVLHTLLDNRTRSKYNSVTYRTLHIVCLPQSYAPPLPLLVCTLPSNLIQLVIHSLTYCVLSGLCIFADALLFLRKAFPHSELRGLDKCHLSLKINLCCCC